MARASAHPRPASIEFQGFDFSPGGGGDGSSATFEELFSDVVAAPDARGAFAGGRPERGGGPVRGDSRSRSRKPCAVPNAG